MLRDVIIPMLPKLESALGKNSQTVKRMNLDPIGGDVVRFSGYGSVDLTVYDYTEEDQFFGFVVRYGGGYKYGHIRLIIKVQTSDKFSMPEMIFQDSRYDLLVSQEQWSQRETLHSISESISRGHPIEVSNLFLSLILNGISWNPQFRWDNQICTKPNESIVAFTSALHPRLGSDSVLKEVPPFLFEKICLFASGSSFLTKRFRLFNRVSEQLASSGGQSVDFYNSWLQKCIEERSYRDPNIQTPPRATKASSSCCVM